MTVSALRFDGVTAESSTLHRTNLTIWLSPSALTEWSGDPVEAFEIPRSMLRTATVVERPRGHAGAVALTATLHGRYVRWLIRGATAESITALKAWVAQLKVAP